MCYVGAIHCLLGSCTACFTLRQVLPRLCWLCCQVLSRNFQRIIDGGGPGADGGRGRQGGAPPLGHGSVPTLGQGPETPGIWPLKEPRLE